MTEVEKVASIYRRLPPDAQREALDFLLFLERRRGLAEGGSSSRALDLLTEVGFIGSLQAEPDLSENYKESLTRGLEAKYGDG